MTTWRNLSDPDSAATTTWNYDAYRGWLTNKTYDGGSPGPVYSNTPAGRLAFRAWARGTNAVYTYNTAGDLSQVDYSDGTGISYSYTRRGQLNTVTSGSSVTSFAYEPSGQLVSELWSGGTLDGLLVTNSFDQFLRRTNLSLFGPSSALLASTTYGYGAASRLHSVTDGANTATYSYLANSPLVSQINFTNNGQWRMTTSKSYDFLNRLTQISSVPSASSVVSFAYAYNPANQRVRCTLSGGSFWIYEYDRLGQLKSAKRYWPDWTPVAGQQFEYAFDDIGNRTSTKADGDENGLNLRSATYGANSLNQYTNRTVPGAFDILGLAFATNSVTVNGQAAYRRGEYFCKEIPVDNSGGPVYPQVTVSAAGTNVSGHFFLPKSPENFSHDADGNLAEDGRWTYTWDAENRLAAMEALSTVPDDAKLRLEFAYDWQGRRISKTVYTNSSGTYVPSYTNRFAYDGWNLVAEFNVTNGVALSYLWGLDLSGTLHGAGGVGGLLALRDMGTISGQPSSHLACFDGNGNVAALLNASDSTISALYEYGPFGETLRRTGPMAEANPFRFSTKYQDGETDLLYYGYRYYNPSTGRWLSYDPVGEEATPGLSVFCDNQPVGATDYLGQWTYWVHYWKTDDWSLARGFRDRYAGIMAIADKRLDDVLSGHSSFPVVGEQDRHMHASREGTDSRTWWYHHELRNAVDLLKQSDTSMDEQDCVKAAEAFGRGLHSSQDKSAHYEWPSGVILRGVIPHPGWWDAYLDSELTASLGFEWWWHAFVHLPPRYDSWQNTTAQRLAIGSARYAVAQDSADALTEFKAEVQRHCFCRSLMLSSP